MKLMLKLFSKGLYRLQMIHSIQSHGFNRGLLKINLRQEKRNEIFDDPFFKNRDFGYCVFCVFDNSIIADFISFCGKCD